MTEKRFILVDDEWIGLDGAGHLIAIEDSASPKKTVYFAYKVNAKAICDLLNELYDENEQLESDLQMSREKALYWRNKAEDIFGDMKTNIELKQENEQLKKELQKYTEIHFRNENGTHTVLYEKKE